MWKKAESASTAQNQIKFQSVKRQGYAFKQENKLNKKAVSKIENGLNGLKSRKKTRTIDPKNAENELK